MAKLDEKAARKARVACEKWREYFKQNIDKYHMMTSFVLGQQWTDEETEEMVKTYRKVAMTAPKLGTMSNALLGEQQQNTPQLQVVPMSGCDEKVAHIREIITKDIMFSAQATIAREKAAKQMAIGGYGAYCLGTDYTHSKSFDLDIKYYSCDDPTRYYWSMDAQESSKIDSTNSGYITRMSKQKFRQLYGKEILDDIMKNVAITQSEEEIALAVQPNESTDPFTWADNEGVTILNHFERKSVNEMLYKMSNGETLDQEEMDDLIESSKKTNKRNQMLELEQLMMGRHELQIPDDAMQQQMLEQMPQEQEQMQGINEILPQSKEMAVMPPPQQMPMKAPAEDEDGMMTLWMEGEPVRIEEKRKAKKYKVIHQQISGNYVLDETVFPAEYSPVIYMDYNSYYDKNGKQITRSFFDDCVDTQKYINYLRTQSAYILKVSRYDQWIGSKKNVASLDSQRNWRDPTSIQGMLTYDESPNGDKPFQIQPPELSQSLFQQYQLAIEDLYTSSGLYPARMGNNGDEASGKALNARTRQGSYQTYVFFNSVNRSCEADGRVLNQMIPRVIDSQRVLTLMMPDEGMKNITVNRQMDEYGEQIENDIRKGTYEVRLLPGPSYEGQKQEALESLQSVLQADPTAFALIADLYADNLPLANTLEIKNRLKTRVSPAIIEAGKTGKMPEDGKPDPEQQMVQLQQQQVEMEGQFKQAQIQIKMQELQLKEKQMQVDLEIERQKLQAEEMRVMGEIEESKLRYMAETDRTESDSAISHANNLVKILTSKIA